MPIRVQSDLPAAEILENENIFVMDENRAMHQDIRPLKVAILNLMPIKQDTELQLLRALSNTPLQIDVTFVMASGHVSLNTSASHLNKFYVTFDQVKEKFKEVFKKLFGGGNAELRLTNPDDILNTGIVLPSLSNTRFPSASRFSEKPNPLIGSPFLYNKPGV